LKFQLELAKINPEKPDFSSASVVVPLSDKIRQFWRFGRGKGID